MNIKPLADRVLIKPVAAEEVTVAGIIIPDSAKEKPLKGTVVAAGCGTKDEEMTVKPATLCSTANIQATRSNSRAKNTSSCVRATSSLSWNKRSALTSLTINSTI